jgi:hypothetical protein
MIKSNTFEHYEIELDGLVYFCTFNAEAKEYSWGGTYFDPPEYEFEVTGIADLEVIYYDEDNNEIKVGSEIVIEIAEDYLYETLSESDF